MIRNLTPTAAILGILLILQLCYQFWSSLSWGHESYQITDWLINYAGGFVRRGLPGSLIGIVSESTGILANHLAIAVSFLCYLILLSWFLRKSSPTFPTALILSCIVMGFPAYQDSIVRKDCLGLLLLLGCFKTIDNNIPKVVAMIVVNLLASIAILSHETFAFFAMPALVFFLRKEDTGASLKDMAGRSLALAPAAFVFLLVAIHHGTPQIATAVHESWMPLWRTLASPEQQIGEPAASIGALGWNAEQGMYLSTYMLTSGLYQPLAWAMAFTASFFLVVLFTGRDEKSNEASGPETKVVFISILIAQLVFISPLFILGVDYGRWLFLWIASSMMLQITGRRAPLWLETIISQIFIKSKIRFVIGKVPVKDWYLLLFGVPVVWSIHNFLTASPLGRHIEMIRTWF